jgi:predicted aspartyl protease
MNDYAFVFIFSFILGILILVAFFNMASRIADIRKEVRIMSQRIQAGRTYIEYQEAQYRFNKLYPRGEHPQSANEHKVRIEEKINGLMG